jgi:hypothetical protein
LKESALNHPRKERETFLQMLIWLLCSQITIFTRQKSDDERSLGSFLTDWYLRIYAGSLPNQNSERAAASAPGPTHSNLVTYSNVCRPPPNPGKTSLFVRQNEVSPSKTEVFPGNSDYKNDFPPGENEVYPLESSLQNEVYPGEFRLGGQALRTATQCTMDLHQIQANFKHFVC